MTDLDLLARYYDIIHTGFEDDLPLWDTLAASADGPILDVGCGTGRLLQFLADPDCPLVGLDSSTEALARARRKLSANGLQAHVSLIQADMRHFDPPRRDFALAILSLNTFMHCQSTEDQLATLQSIHHCLRPGGLLAVDLFYPDPLLQAEVDGRLYFEAEFTDPDTGLPVQWYWRHEFDLAEQVRHLTYVLDTINADGLVHRVVIPVSLRYVYRFEMELLLKMSGYSLETIFGDYNLEPFEHHSPRMIFVAAAEK
ncbi:MAG: class I SAM-dependent methyltransferase [Chloroflexi bacterium]|nr:MAG: class I SAM-dependent methyltransferase [Chloroflexota bacterium]